MTWALGRETSPGAIDHALDGLVEDITEEMWNALVTHPQFESLTPLAFVGFHRVIREALERHVRVVQPRVGAHPRAERVGPSPGLFNELDELIHEMTDRVSLIIWDVTGGTMPYGPLQASVEAVVEQSLGPYVESMPLECRRDPSLS